MTLAWRRLGDVPADDPLPWLYATARNLVWAEARRSARSARPDGAAADQVDGPELFELDPAMGRALRALAPIEREALLLVAWEELTPKQAAHALGVSGPAFRVRLLRARRRIQAFLKAEESPVSPQPLPDMETT
jgi:RNA polymerase sigma-70 factor (ECF subfamily)